LGGKAYFRKPYKAQDPLTTLEWGKGLMSFSRNSMYHHSSIKVIGFDEPNKDVLVAEVSSKSDDAQSEPIADPQQSVYTQPDALEIAEVEKRAENEGRRRKQRTQGGSGTCIGLPEVVPGRFIDLQKLDGDIDGKYYITNVSHSLGSGGFTTRFNIGGWK
jgi:phage protein D